MLYSLDLRQGSLSRRDCKYLTQKTKKTKKKGKEKEKKWLFKKLKYEITTRYKRKRNNN